jgi:hypothetical protein
MTFAFSSKLAIYHARIGEGSIYMMIALPHS